MKRGTLIGIGSVAVALLTIGSVVYAGVGNSSVASPTKGQTLNLPNTNTPVSNKISHDPLSQIENQTLGWAGLVITPLNGNSPDAQGILPEDAAIQSTNILMQQFGATARNIELVKASKHIDSAGKQAAEYTAEQTHGDPNFINNKFENIPCYLVVLHGIDVPASGGKQGSALHLPDHNAMIALIDATTGANLIMYTFHE